MSNSDNGGCFAVFAILIPIAGWLGTGYLAWDWVEPESFGGAIKFLIAWAIFGYIAQLLAGLIIAGIASMME